MHSRLVAAILSIPWWQWVLLGSFGIFAGIGLWKVITGHKDKRLTALGGIDPVQLEALLFGGMALIVDLRAHDVFNSSRGHITGSLNIPYPELRFRMKELHTKPPRPVVLVDEVGDLAIVVAKILKEEGNSWVYFLKGGMNAWRRSHMKVVIPTEAKKA